MPQWTAFQLDHPMGGVRATPSLDASTLTRVSDKGTILEQRNFKAVEPNRCYSILELPKQILANTKAYTSYLQSRL